MNPHPDYANGPPKELIPTQESYLLCWCPHVRPWLPDLRWQAQPGCVRPPTPIASFSSRASAAKACPLAKSMATTCANCCAASFGPACRPPWWGIWQYKNHQIPFHSPFAFCGFETKRRWSDAKNQDLFIRALCHQLNHFRMSCGGTFLLERICRLFLIIRGMSLSFSGTRRLARGHSFSIR